jgi:hypothetical protein
MNKVMSFLTACAVALSVAGCAVKAEAQTLGQAPAPGGPASVSKVYMTEDISPAGIAAVYGALGRTASGKVAVKISTGEPGGHNFLQPALIGGFVKSVNGTIVESNTAYGGGGGQARRCTIRLPKTTASRRLRR